MQIPNIPNLCVGEGGKLSNMGEPQKSFFLVYKIFRFEKHRGPGTAPTVLHPAEDMSRPSLTTVTGWKPDFRALKLAVHQDLLGLFGKTKGSGALLQNHRSDILGLQVRKLRDRD